MLQHFSTTYQNAASLLQQETIEEDREKALHLAHNVKGVSANLGAINLPQLAGELEYAIKEQQETPDMIKAFGIALEDLLAAISECTKADEKETLTKQLSDRPIDAQQVGDLLADLRELLVVDYAQTQDILDKLDYTNGVPQVRST